MPSAFKELLPDKLKFSSLPWVSYLYHRSELESTDAGTQNGKETKQKYEHLTKGCCPQGASKVDKSVLRRSRRIPKLLVESISVLKLVNHNFSHHYFYITIITYILVQYCGHYFSESNCKPDQKETCCEGESVPIQTNKLRLFIWYSSCTRLDKWLILWLYFWRNWSNVQIKACTVPLGSEYAELVVPLLTFACGYFGGYKISCDTAVVDVRARDYTHHHSPNPKYLPTPPQQVLVVTRTVALAQ